MIGFSPRRSLTAHQDWKEVLETLRAKFHTYVSCELLVLPFTNSACSVKLPKSFVAIDLSENGRSSKGKENGDAKFEEGERGRSEERKDETKIPSADENGNVAAPHTSLETEERKDGVKLAGLPPPAMGA
jgi:hypothetical protein